MGWSGCGVVWLRTDHAPPRPIRSHPIPSHPVLSQPTLSHLTLPHPIQSHLSHPSYPCCVQAVDAAGATPIVIENILEGDELRTDVPALTRRAQPTSHYTMPRHTTPHHATPHHTTPRHITPCHTSPRHATPHHATPHRRKRPHTTAHHITPCHLCHTTIPLHHTLLPTTPHHTTRYHTTSHYSIPHHTTLLDTTPYHTTPYHFTPHYSLPHHTTLLDTTPHHTTPHYSIPLHHTLLDTSTGRSRSLARRTSSAYFPPRPASRHAVGHLVSIPLHHANISHVQLCPPVWHLTDRLRRYTAPHRTSPPHTLRTGYDKLLDISRAAKDAEVPHIVNNAYGVQCSRCVIDGPYELKGDRSQFTIHTYTPDSHLTLHTHTHTPHSHPHSTPTRPTYGAVYATYGSMPHAGA